MPRVILESRCDATSSLPAIKALRLAGLANGDMRTLISSKAIVDRLDANNTPITISVYDPRELDGALIYSIAHTPPSPLGLLLLALAHMEPEEARRFMESPTYRSLRDSL